MRFTSVLFRIADFGLRFCPPPSALRLPPFFPRLRVVALAVACLFAPAIDMQAADGAASYASIARNVQPKVVKLYGTGGFQGLESYQSGLLISPKGHVLTVWSYVLDGDDVVVVL